MTRFRQHPRHARATRKAFTLIEVALAIIIVGVGSIALMQLSAACTFQNRASSDRTTAALLAEQVREMLADLPLNDPTVGSTHFGPEPGETLASYDDVDDFDGQTFSPVRDATRATMPGFDGYTQSVVLNLVNGKQLSGNQNGASIAKSAYTGALRLTININKLDPTSGQSNTVFSINCIRVEE